MISFLRRSLLPTCAALVPLFGGSSLSAAYDLYWSEYSGTPGSAVLMGSDIDGQNPAEVFRGTEMASYIVDIVVTDEHLYWTGHRGGDVWRANRDGSEAQRLIEPETGLSAVHNLVIDEAAGKMYIADYENGVFSANLDGSALMNLWGGNPTLYTGIDLRNSNELLWLTASTDWLYLQPLPAGYQPGAVQLQGGDATYGLAYDATTDIAYFSNINRGTLGAYNLTTDEQAEVVRNLTEPLGLKLSPGGTHLLIAERGRGISAYQLDNDGYELLVDAPNAHFGVAVTADPGELSPPEPEPPPPFLGHLEVDFEDVSLGEVLYENLGDLVHGNISNFLAHWRYGENDPGINDDPDYVPPPLAVVADTENRFGEGSENKILRSDGARGWTMEAENNFNLDVMTIRSDMIVDPITNGRLNYLFENGAGEQIALFQIEAGGGANGRFGYSSGGIWEYGVLNRFEAVVNASADPITYGTPGGGTKTLVAGGTDMWVNGILVFEDFLGQRQATTYDPIMSVTVKTAFSNTPWRGDIAQIRTFEGVQLAPAPFYGHLEVDFEDVSLGEVLYENLGDLVHGNISNFLAHWRYGENDPGINDDPDYVPPPLVVVEDTENRFGEGSENKILRSDGARGWTMEAENNFNLDVMTVRSDMIVEPITNGRLNYLFESGAGEQIALFQIEAGGGANGRFGYNSGGTWEYGVLNRFEAVINASADSITYGTPGGGTKTLVAGGTDMWVNGSLVFEDFLGQRQAETYDRIMSVTVKTAFSNTPWRGDIAQIRTFEGVQLAGVEQGGDAGYTDWLEQHFPGETNPAIVGNDADPDGDGVSNLLEYALGSDPNVSSRDGLPVVGLEALMEDGVGSIYLTLTFTKPDDVTDVAYSVEIATELGGWAAGGELVDSVSNGDGTSTYTYRDTVPLEDESRRFMRLSVSELAN